MLNGTLVLYLPPSSLGVLLRTELGCSRPYKGVNAL